MRARLQKLRMAWRWRRMSTEDRQQAIMSYLTSPAKVWPTGMGPPLVKGEDLPMIRGLITSMTPKPKPKPGRHRVRVPEDWSGWSVIGDDADELKRAIDESTVLHSAIDTTKKKV